jgi:large conductance mechanosensitive channel
MISEFRAFLTRTNALALAVGVIVGAAIGNVVSSFAADILMPLVGKLLPNGDWRSARIVLTTGHDANGKITENAILYGHFAGTVIDFVIISFVVFLIVRWLIRPAPDPATKKCPECLETKPAAARRCRACTASVA